MKVSVPKTQALYIRPGTKKRKAHEKGCAKSPKHSKLMLDEERIEFKDNVRYLSVHLGEKLNVDAHCEYLDRKTSKIFAAFRRVSKETWGPDSKTMATICKGAVASIVTYASAAWSDLCTAGNMQKLRSLQKKTLSVVSGSYRLAAGSAINVIASTLPIHLQMERTRARYLLKKDNDVNKLR